jgi:tetratricopeptide (TPR) repeat protein
VVRARGAYADALKLFEAKQYKEAVIEALLCIEFDSKNADCQKLAGDAHAALEEPEKAVERYQAFLRLAPEDPRTAEVERTVARLSAPPPEDTSSPAPEEAHPAASVRRAPVSTAAREQAKKAYDSAMSQVRYRRFKEAAVSASRCLSADPGYAECHMLLGAAYIGTNRWEQAAAEYRKFLELAPDHPQAPRVRMSLERYEMTKSW